MSTTGYITGRIDTEWAQRVSQNRFDIWRCNRTATETIDGSIALQNLGGLVVRLTEKLYEPSEAIEIGRVRLLANLSFDEIGRITLTESLLDAAIARGGEADPLAQDLRAFVVQTGRPAWLMPATAIEVMEPAIISS